MERFRASCGEGDVISSFVKYMALLIAVAVLLSVAFKSIKSVCHRAEDKFNGSATSGQPEEDDASNDMKSIPRCFYSAWIVLIATTVGTIVAFAKACRLGVSTSRLDYQFVDCTIEIVAWGINLMSTTSLLITLQHQLKVECGFICAIGLVALSISSVFDILEYVDHQGMVWQNRDHISISLGALQATVGLVGCIGSLSIPQRPDAAYAGHTIDRYHTVSLLGKWTLAWASGVISLVRSKNPLAVNELPMLHENLRSAHLLAHTDYQIDKRPLWKAVLHKHRRKILVQSMCGIAQSVTQFVPSILLLIFLRLLESQFVHETSRVSLWILILGLGLSLFLSAWLDVWTGWSTFANLALPIHSELSASIYLRTMSGTYPRDASEVKFGSDAEGDGHNHGKRNTNTGEDESHENFTGSESSPNPINLLSVDVRRLYDFLLCHYTILQTFTKLIISMVLLKLLLGWRSLTAGILGFFILLPVNVWASRQSATAQGQLMNMRDRKLQIVREASRARRQIKLWAQEVQWQARISSIRRAELDIQWRIFVFETALIFCYNFGVIALSAVALATHAAINKELSASLAFTSITIFSVLESSLVALPELIIDGLKASASVGRIEQYLKFSKRDYRLRCGRQIIFQDATIAWHSDILGRNHHPFMLLHISLQIPGKKLTVICGPTGSGKSLLLASIIGEARLLGGRCILPSEEYGDHQSTNNIQGDDWIIDSAMAFVGQATWMENTSIRRNILFGLPFEKDRYEAVLIHCDLEQDLGDMPHGDETIVATDNVSLSGGQRWRISLARALYSRAGILVLDDFLSAVDNHVAQHLLDEGLLGGLGRNRTCILATHHVGLCVPKATWVVVLDSGHLKFQGPPGDLHEISFLALTGKKTSRAHRVNFEHERLRAESQPLTFNLEGTDMIHQPDKSMEEENKGQAPIHWKTYLAYFHGSGSYRYWLPLLALFIGHQILLLGRTHYLGNWTRSSSTEEKLPMIVVQSQHLAHGSDFNHAGQYQGLIHFLSIYLSISIILCITSAARYFFVYKCSIQGSKHLFEVMTFTVLRAPLRWLDTTPTGQILNRFMADTELIDSRLGTCIGALIYSILQMLSIVISAILGSAWMMFPAAILLLMSIRLTRWYIGGARVVKRLESTARSPILGLVSSTISGLATIRTYRRTQAYVDYMLPQIDLHSRALWCMRLFRGWIDLRLNILGTAFTTIVAVSCLLSKTDASSAGFALSFALQYSVTICLVTRVYGSVELAMNSTERVLEYTDMAIEEDDDSSIEVPASWPTEGRLDVCGLEVGYASHLPSVLKDMTFSIASNERVGIVGRTGAGKSSIALALFRLLKYRAGAIFVDDVDISRVSLSTLRSRITIIPQDPVLFSGSVRSNIDDTGTSCDAELEDILQRVLLSSSRTQDLTLDTFVTESGLNLSQGQRQLICLARAIKARPRILVLDEATCAMDHDSDQLVQRTVREEFSNTTLLVIAHRLSTVADFDKILVVEDGRVVEFGSPRELLLNSNHERGFQHIVDSSQERDMLRHTILT